MFIDFMSSVFNVSYQLSMAAISARSSPFSLFTLSQKIKPNTSPTHQIIKLSIPLRRRRDETDSKCAFVKVIICLCHRLDWIWGIKRTHCNFYLIIGGAARPKVIGWTDAACSCTRSHTHAWTSMLCCSSRRDTILPPICLQHSTAKTHKPEYAIHTKQIIHCNVCLKYQQKAVHSMHITLTFYARAGTSAQIHQQVDGLTVVSWTILAYHPILKFNNIQVQKLVLWLLFCVNSVLLLIIQTLVFIHGTITWTYRSILRWSSL